MKATLLLITIALSSMITGIALTCLIMSIISKKIESNPFAGTLKFIKDPDTEEVYLFLDADEDMDYIYSKSEVTFKVSHDIETRK